MPYLIKIADFSHQKLQSINVVVGFSCQRWINCFRLYGKKVSYLKVKKKNKKLKYAQT